jgi:hypothetical protein
MQLVIRRPQPRSFSAFLLLAGSWFVIQTIVASPVLVRVWTASLGAHVPWWDRADSVEIPTFLVLQSVCGAFLLWRSRRSPVFGLHAAKGIAYGLLSFPITAFLTYLVLISLYEPIRTIPPLFFFWMLFFLGHRVPLLGVALGGLLAAAVHWVLTESRT